MTESVPGAGGRAFVALQHLLPQHGISRLVLAATRSRNPTFKNALIRLFVRGFNPDIPHTRIPFAGRGSFHLPLGTWSYELAGGWTNRRDRQ